MDDLHSLKSQKSSLSFWPYEILWAVINEVEFYVIFGILCDFWNSMWFMEFYGAYEILWVVMNKVGKILQNF